MNLVSNLNSEEFESRLNEVVKDGEPEIMGTPLAMLHFNLSSKPLLGRVTSRTFMITRNSIFPPTNYILMGLYKPYEGKTMCDVDIKIVPFGYYWVRIGSILGIILMNTVVAIIAGFQLDFFILMNVCLLLLTGFAIAMDKLTKWRLEYLFKRELQMSNQ